MAKRVRNPHLATPTHCKRSEPKVFGEGLEETSAPEPKKMLFADVAHPERPRCHTEDAEWVATPEGVR